MAPKTEEERKNEEAASRRHARLDNAGILHMSANSGEVHEKVSIVSWLCWAFAEWLAASLGSLLL